MSTAQSSERVNTIREYFSKADAGDASLFNLFTEDVETYFPKYGIGKSKQDLAELFVGFSGNIEKITHDQSSFRFYLSDDGVAVEGLTRGRTKQGVEWTGGKTPAGRFCSVFTFRDSLISRIHVHLDPDFAGQDDARFFWGRGRGRW